MAKEGVTYAVEREECLGMLMGTGWVGWGLESA